ncbi:hypothetical protein [Halobacteriovorax sp.]|uniref:hypothetical protein n=1 Tax=Halobacteriovorax sp. TaxID=2020862 RepID=UPI00356A834B
MERFSARIQQFSKSTDYVGSSGNSSFEVRFGDLRVNFNFTVTRGVLTELLYETEQERVENGIYFAICKILKGADLQRIKSISSREVESFLRDQNHIPAMGESPFPFEVVDTIRNLLVTSIFEYELADDLDFWRIASDATYVDKIKAISEFFTLKINMSDYFTQEKVEIELIQLEEDTFFVELSSSVNSVKLAPNFLPKEALSVIEGLVRSVINSENINLVAE